jgi:carboxyl-terminal processing protease
MDTVISKKTWTNYIASLDFERMYFMATDIDTFRSTETDIIKDVKKGDIGFAQDAFSVFKQRIGNRYEYVQELLEKGFDTTIDETYEYKRRNAAWASNEDEWNELWRKRIKNEYINGLIAKELKSANDEPVTNDLPQPASVEESITKRYKNLLTVMQDSDAEYVLERFLSSVAHAYDPHSSYMSPSSLSDFDIQMKLSLVGIGALLRAEDGAAMIVKIIPGGPASKDERKIRLVPGDKIVAVAQGDKPPVNIVHLPLYKIVKLIRGEKDTTVVLTVIPKADPTGSTTKIIDLVRGEIKLEDGAASSEVRAVSTPSGEMKMGVIRLPAFYANMHAKSPDDPAYRSSAHDVEKLLDELNTQDVQGVILDLRHNGGGSLLEAIWMVGHFISSGPVVQVKERFRRVLDDQRPGIVYGGPLVVLVDRLSASASEIVAGALQDYERAIIIGDTKTHGKGTVQTIVYLDPDSTRLGAIKVTTAGYYRISGRTTQLEGIRSDIVLSSPFDFKDWGEDSLPNALELLPISAAKYSTVASLDPLMTTLKEDSLLRRKDSATYGAYTNLLDQIRRLNETKQLPLKLSVRREMAEAERKISDLQEELSPAMVDENEDKEKSAPDVVLDESLQILADMVTLKQNQARVIPPLPPAFKRTPVQQFFDWLLGV